MSKEKHKRSLRTDVLAYADRLGGSVADELRRIVAAHPERKRKPAPWSCSKHGANDLEGCALDGCPGAVRALEAMPVKPLEPVICSTHHVPVGECSSALVIEGREHTKRRPVQQ